jgi:hypothetical protein
MTTATAPAAAPANELSRLELLRAYKERLVKGGEVNLSPFALDRVIRYDSDVDRFDVPDIHRDARDRIAKIIKGIHEGHDSQVVILAGDPGMGKSHLINHFRAPEVADELGYVLVGNSNHWEVEEFEDCLLKWVIEALVRPSPNQPHLLLTKIQDLAFEALSQVLAQPGQLRRFERPRRLLGRLWRKLRPGHDRFRQLVEARDPRAFGEIDFARFSGYVCDRFLHNSGDPFHRHVLRVLLLYLFEEERERVLHWLRRREVSFLKATGVEERIDAKYKVIDAVKILVSLFTSEVSKNLRAGEKGREGDRVFFFAFDQMEGRQELFKNDGEWMKFFGQLSELYNTLPNVFVLFTMTLALRNKLYPQMEGQFQDRIIRDERFQLHRIADAERLALYRKRVDCWLAGAVDDVREQVAGLNEPYLPFTQEKVLEVTDRKTLREALAALDEAFCRFFETLVTGPRVDYLGFLNAFRTREQSDSPTDYTANHLDRVKQLFDRHGTAIAAAYGLSFTSSEWRATEQKLPALWLEFRDPDNTARWVRVFLVRLPWNYNAYAPGAIDLLRNLRTGANFLWLVRPTKIDEGLEGQRAGQVFTRVLAGSTHSAVQALIELLGNRDQYPSEERELADEIIREAIKPTYLGSMLRQLRDALNAQQGQVPPDEGEATDPPGDPS